MELTPGSWAGSGEDLIRHNSSEFKNLASGRSFVPGVGFFERFMEEKKGGKLKSTSVFLHAHKMWHF